MICADGEIELNIIHYGTVHGTSYFKVTCGSTGPFDGISDDLAKADCKNCVFQGTNTVSNRVDELRAEISKFQEELTNKEIQLLELTRRKSAGK